MDTITGVFNKNTICNQTGQGAHIVRDAYKNNHKQTSKNMLWKSSNSLWENHVIVDITNVLQFQAGRGWYHRAVSSIASR